jgi:hypothetical protein
MVGGTGTPTPISGEATADKSSVTLTFNGAPVAGYSYQVQCIGE